MIKSRNRLPVTRPHLTNIRKKNRHLVLQTIQSAKILSRHDLVERTGLKRASVTRIVRDLIEEGVCREDRSYHAESNLGRPRVELVIDPDGGTVVAICLSAFSRSLALIDIAGGERARIDLPGDAMKTTAQAVEVIGVAVDRLEKDGLLVRKKLLGVGLSIAGSIRAESGYVSRAPLLGWSDFPIRDALSRRLSCSVHVENIADALCLTCLEQRAPWKGPGPNIFLVHVAAGMGASFSIDGTLVRRRGDEGWIGNIPVNIRCDSAKGIRRLNELSSGYAILNALGVPGRRTHRSTSGFATRLTNAVEQANLNDGAERNVFFSAGETLGEALMPLTSAYFPDFIYLAGPVAQARSFEEGLRLGYRKAASGTDAMNVELLLNKTTYLESAKNIAIQRFFCSSIVLNA